MFVVDFQSPFPEDRIRTPKACCFVNQDADRSALALHRTPCTKMAHLINLRPCSGDIRRLVLLKLNDYPRRVVCRLLLSRSLVLEHKLRREVVRDV